jgi:hypothetical protein
VISVRSPSPASASAACSAPSANGGQHGRSCNRRNAGTARPALDADDGAPQAGQRLSAVIAAARHAHDVETEVLALDALARIHAEQGRTDDARTMLDTADRIMPAAHHLVTDNERIDRDRARSLLEDIKP